MSRATQYKTKQKEEIIDCLKAFPNVQIRVTDIIKYFAERGVAIGTATIYRHLEQLVIEGSVKKYFVDGISGACFEYVGTSSKEIEPVFYLKCEQCGKLSHFHCKELEHIQRHLFQDHGFLIDSPKTIFYGRCNQCTHS